jgi:hypothetical protein
MRLGGGGEKFIEVKCERKYTSTSQCAFMVCVGTPLPLKATLRQGANLFLPCPMYLVSELPTCQHDDRLTSCSCTIHSGLTQVRGHSRVLLPLTLCTWQCTLQLMYRAHVAVATQSVFCAVGTDSVRSEGLWCRLLYALIILTLCHSTHFYGTWYECYAFRVHSKDVIFTSLHSVITTWRTRELVRQQLH